MTLIQTVAPAQAEGTVAEVYREVELAFGRIPNVFQLLSSSPELLSLQWQRIRFYQSHPTLSMPLLATIRMLVSAAHDCEYCVDFNAGLLINLADQTPEQVAATRQDPNNAPLSDKDKAMLLITLRATEAPKSISAEDLNHLRDLGWRDRDILEAIHHAAYNMAADAVIDSFKVDRDF